MGSAKIERAFGASLNRALAGSELDVAGDATWFRVSGETVEIRGRRLLRKLLLALVRSHYEQPGRSVSTAELIQRVWPGDRSPHASARNRLYFAMNALRDLGLREVLVRSSGGYQIATDVVVRVSSEDRPPVQ
jgi:DNA-binding winged helix-turn-helix (wHTH) protein